MHFSQISSTSLWKTASTLLICFAIAAPLISKKTGQIAAGLILIFGLLSYLLVLLKRNQIPPIERPEKLMAIGSLLLLLSLVINVLIFSDLSHIGGKTDQYSYFLVPLLLLPILRLSKINTQTLTYTLSFTSVIVGILTIIEYSQTHQRTGVLFHGQSIPFGNLALITGFSCLTFLNLNNSKVKNIFLISCASLAIIASISSQTRGGLIAIPALIILLVFFKKEYFLRKKVILYFIGLTFISVTVLLNSGMLKKVESRLNSAVSQINSYYENDNKATSVGVRLDLWKIALEGWRESPLFGKGITEFYHFKADKIGQEPTDSHLLKYQHPHNEYIGLLFSQGVLGLIVYGLLISTLAIYYFRRSKESPIALTGLLVTSGYLIFSLTESFFSLHTSLFFYLTLNTVLLYLLSQDRHAQGSSSHVA